MIKKKIYFACNILGATEDDRKRYAEIINILKRYGHVMTDYFGDTEKLEEKEKIMSDTEIFTQDLEMLEEASCVVAEVSKKGHGVGVELGIMSGKKPILCIKREDGSRLSPMIAGNKEFSVEDILYF